MATIKVKFRLPVAEGREGTVYYQLVHCNVTRVISTCYRLFPDEWDFRHSSVRVAGNVSRRSYLQLVQDKICWEVKQMRMIVLQMESYNLACSIDELAETLRRLPPCQSVFCFIKLQIGKKEHMKRLGTAKTYNDAFRKFCLFRNGHDLAFGSLTADIVESYDAWLFNQGLKQNTIAYYLRTLRTLYHKAVEEGQAEERDIFRHVRTSSVSTVKRAMSVEDIRSLLRLPLRQGSPLAFARDMFMFSLYMRGMAFVDMAFLKKKSVRHGMLAYNRRKTNQSMEIEWVPPVQRIVDAYASRTKGSPYLLPIIRKEDGSEYKRYKQVLQNVNRNLGKIGEMLELKMPLTLYVARHSWASTALHMDISLAAISEGMGHNSYKTTQIYLESIGSNMVNEANKTIIQAILG
ncbi:MAG: site-specific integrase [Bacteroidales bacterium]|nr:site-specific integrase [Bacteroidales bacterium]MCM1148048.1 site-specific integrase [Bacteroidales bacterium]MCM1206865.1 site-specific integrase [Bacillota bacterium]MCM1510994.1 site-specific integrase [Clostridium sp.]